VDLQVSGNVELAARIPDVLAGSPAIIPVRLKGGMEAIEITVNGRVASGTWSRTLEVRPENAPEGSGANAQLFAGEKVQELELAGAAGEPVDSVDARIERLGIDFQIATRRTSWVAVSEGQTVDPTEATKTVTMPHELAAGLSAEGIGLRSAMGTMAFGETAMAAPAPMAAAPGLAKSAMASRSGPQGELKRARKPRFNIPLFDAASGQRPGGDLPPTEDDDEDISSSDSWERHEAEEFADLDFREPLPKELSGKVLHWKDGQLVLAIAVEVDLDWKLPVEVTFLCADGSRGTAKVTLDRSTASSTVRAGQSIRLTLVGVPESARDAVTGVQIAGPALTPITVSITK